MRSVNEYTADIEADRRDRESEIRALISLLPKEHDSVEGKPIRRALVLLIYAHLEGYTRFAFSTYLEAVNARALQFRAASIQIAATSATDVFLALNNSQKKSDIFRRALPDDTVVHRAARQQEFVLEYENRMGDRVVRLSEKMLNFESNLSADVLRRNLFMVGLDQQCVTQHGIAINTLLHVRNAVAHGDRLKDPDFDFVEKHLLSALDVMKTLQTTIQTALTDELFLREELRVA